MTPGIEPRTRRELELFFGTTFADVRVHTDAHAHAAATALDADAFAVGHDVFFADGRYEPHSQTGRRLLAHELAHVVQGAGTHPVRRKRRPRHGGEVGVAGEPDETVTVPDVFAGKQYDTTTKQGVLDYAQDWHTQLLREYQPYLTSAYGTAPGLQGVSFTKQQRTGRAFFIYTAHYWPVLQRRAETDPPSEVFAAVTAAVNSAIAEAESEEASATRIAPADYRTLFPDTFAKQYDAEATKARKEGLDGFEELEKWKVKTATDRDRNGFVLFASGQYRPLFVAELHEQEAARIRKGQWSPLPFDTHKAFLWMDAHERAESVAAAEYDRYVARAANPGPLWTESLITKGHWVADLAKQHKDDKDASGAERDLAALAIMASTIRNTAGRDAVPPSLIDAWNRADEAMIGLRPAAARGAVPSEAKAAARTALDQFYRGFRAEVKSHDVTRVVARKRRVKITETKNPYFTPDAKSWALSDFDFAQDRKGWKKAFDRYNDAVGNLDGYIAARLEAKGQKGEGEKLKLLGWRARALADLLEEQKDARKVQAVFYPKNELENTGQPGAPGFVARGIPLLFYIYREDDEWNLADVTTPHKVKVTSGSGGDEATPDPAIFSKCNSKLRFPEGRIYYTLPDGGSWVLETTEPWRLSEWLTWIGLTIAAIALAIVTFGGSIPASVIVIGAAIGVAAGTADIIEKKRAGVLTTKDVLVDGVQIVGSLLTMGAARLGQVVMSRAAAAGAAASEVGGLAGRAFVPVTLAALGADVTSFAILTSDTLQALEAIDKQPGSESDRRLAKIRLVAQMIGLGVMSFVAIRGSIRATQLYGAKLHIDTGANGEVTARPMLADDELLKAGKSLGNVDDIGHIMGDVNLSTELRDRIRAGLSEALTTGPIAPAKLEQLLTRMRTATHPDEVNGVLAELNARSRVSTISDPDVAARLTRDDATALATLDDATFRGLKGAAADDLERVASVVRTDVKEGARLLGEYGPDLIAYVRRHPFSDLAQLEDVLAKQRAQITSRVAGVYENIDTTKPPEGGWRFDNRRGVYLDDDGVTKVIETKVRGPNGADGFFERAYNPVTGTLELRMAFLRMPGAKKALPNMVEKQAGGTEMVEGKGTPTVQFITLYQMKLLGVPLGDAGLAGVKTIHMSNIQNVETIVHLHWLRQRFPGTPVNSLIEFTASVKYGETTVVQSGYQRSGPPVVSAGEVHPIRRILAHQERGKPELIEQNRKLLEKYGFTRQTDMLQDFDIDFPVTPQP